MFGLGEDVRKLMLKLGLDDTAAPPQCDDDEEDSEETVDDAGELMMRCGACFFVFVELGHVSASSSCSAYFSSCLYLRFFSFAESSVELLSADKGEMDCGVSARDFRWAFAVEDVELADEEPPDDDEGDVVCAGVAVGVNGALLEPGLENRLNEFKFFM